MVHASRILTRRYHLVMTNPPYLGAGQHGAVLKDFCEAHYKTAKADLANVFLERSLKLCVPGGVVSFVMPQNWLFLKSYQKQREHLLRVATWNLLARLGSGAFEMITGEVVNAILLTLTHAKPAADQPLRGLDASAPRSPGEKAVLLAGGEVVEVSQAGQLGNPDGRVALVDSSDEALLETYAEGLQGVSTSDNPRFRLMFWELARVEAGWRWFQGGCDSTQAYGGCESIVWLSKLVELYELARDNATGENDFQERRAASNESGVYLRGQAAWSQKGVAVRQMRALASTLTQATPFDTNTAVVLPFKDEHLSAIWCFCSSPDYNEAVRRIDQKLNVTNATLVKVPFDLAHWQQVAAERYPDGLPKPYSDDPTQWIFHGHPQPATDPLQVAVARLLGYRWPAESDAAMELSSEARAWIARCKDMDSLVDDDGILCLPAVRGEAAAVDRLRALLSRAFGAYWTGAKEAK